MTTPLSRSCTAAAFFALLLCCAGPPRTAAGQQSAPAAWNLFSARYDTRTSDFIYAVYGYGNVFAMTGLLHNPRSDYSEVLGAVGGKFTLGGSPTQFAAVGMARATESWYVQVYFLPAAHRGPLWFRATSELYLPTEGAGTPQFALSPAAVTLELMPRVEAGVSLDLGLARNSVASTAIGPQLRFVIPGAVISVDAQQGLNREPSRLRLSFLSAF